MVRGGGSSRRVKAAGAALGILATCLVAIASAAAPAVASPGGLDGSFGSGGNAVDQSYDHANGVFVAPPGVTGAGNIDVAATDLSNFQVASYSATGSAIWRVNAGFPVTGGTSSLGNALGVAVVGPFLANSGDVVAVGFENVTQGGCTGPQPAVAEFTPAGAPVFPPTTLPCGQFVSGRFSGVAIDSAGRIVAAGTVQTAGGSEEVVVARWVGSGAQAGALDTTFNSPSGFNTFAPLGASETTNGVAITPTGRIVTAGVFNPPTGNSSVALYAFTSSGLPDGSFGSSGSVTTATPNAATAASAIVALPSGNLAVAGTYTPVGGNPLFLISQYTSSGGLDTTFGGTGQIVNYPALSGPNVFTSLAYQPNGNFLTAAGTTTIVAGTPPGPISQVVAVQYNGTTGVLNPYFGSGGSVVDAYNPQFPSNAYGIAAQPDGKYVVAGAFPVVNAVQYLGLARIMGPTDSAGGPGIVRTTKTGPLAMGFTAALDEPLAGQVTEPFCGSAGTNIDGQGQCAYITFPAGVTRVGLSVVYNVTSPPGTTTTVYVSPAGAQSGVSPGASGSATVQHLRTAVVNGYWMVASDGGIFNFGNAHFYGSTGAVHLTRPIVGMAPTADGKGYWMVASDGGIFTFGDAHFYGSTGAVHLTRPIVGMAPTADGRGYWLVASDGGIFTFGDAHFYGSTGAVRLAQPIVSMAATSDGRGYWLVASDGGVFAFGDAHFYGSTGGVHLARPIVGMAAYPAGNGYWMVASDGGIFSFGQAAFHGSTGGIRLVKPIVGMAPTSDGLGYWLVASDGGIFTFGDAHFYGSTGGIPLVKPIVGMAS
jgi:uncharacterized delta-60 repeat protein